MKLRLHVEIENADEQDEQLMRVLAKLLGLPLGKAHITITEMAPLAPGAAAHKITIKTTREA